MKRRISSKWTLPVKIFNLLMWTLAPIAVAATFRQAEAVDLSSIVSSIIIVVAFSGYFFWINSRLKFAALDEQNLYISRWFGEKAISLSEIEKVSLMRGGFIWVRVGFKSKTEFGKKILFMPTIEKILVSSWWRYHPILDELRNLASDKKMSDSVYSANNSRVI